MYNNGLVWEWIVINSKEGREKNLIYVALLGKNN